MMLQSRSVYKSTLAYENLSLCPKKYPKLSDLVHKLKKPKSTLIREKYFSFSLGTNECTGKSILIFLLCWFPFH